MSFRGVSATRNLNDSRLLRFLPAVEMTDNDGFAKVSTGIWEMGDNYGCCLRTVPE